MKNFINEYFNQEDYFYIFMLNNSDTTDFKQFLHNRESFNKFYQKIKYYNDLKYSLYYSFNSFEKKEDKIFRQKKYVKSIKSIIFDIDSNYEDKTTEDILNTIKSFKKPTYIIQTSPSKYQVIYKLKNEISEEKFFKSFEIELEKLINQFHTDNNVKDISKLFRLPYTINHKNWFSTTIIEKNEDLYEISNFFELYEVNEDTQNPLKTILKDKSIQSPTQIDLTPKNIEISPYFKRIWIGINDKLKDPSKTDISYIKRRKLMNDNTDYNTIISEIMKIREITNNPLKRDFKQYYIDRQQFY